MLAVLAAALLSPVASSAGIISDTYSGQTVAVQMVFREALFDSVMFAVTAPAQPLFVLDNSTIGATSAPFEVTSQTNLLLYVVNTNQWFGEERLMSFGNGLFGWEDWVDNDFDDFMFQVIPQDPADAVPEPSLYATVALGLFVIAVRSKRHKSKPCRPGW